MLRFSGLALLTWQGPARLLRLLDLLRLLALERAARRVEFVLRGQSQFARGPLHYEGLHLGLQSNGAGEAPTTGEYSFVRSLGQIGLRLRFQENARGGRWSFEFGPGRKLVPTQVLHVEPQRYLLGDVRGVNFFTAEQLVELKSNLFELLGGFAARGETFCL